MHFLLIDCFIFVERFEQNSQSQRDYALSGTKPIPMRVEIVKGHRTGKANAHREEKSYSLLQTF